MKATIQKLKQYRNLIMVLAVVIALIVAIAADPLGYCAQRAHDRAAIYNQMVIEKAEADRQIAIIKAQTDAELKRIEQDVCVTEDEAGETGTSDEGDY